MKLIKKFMVEFIKKNAISQLFFLKNLLNRYSKLKIKSQNSIDEGRIIYNYLRTKKANNGVIIDVGAHTGDFFSMFIWDKCKIYAFEPDKDMSKWMILDQLKKKNNIYISNLAVSVKDGEELNFYTSEESTGISSLVAFSKSHKFSDIVKTITLKTFLNEKNVTEVKILKIDTEGYDLFVLQGLGLPEIKPDFILCEFEDNKTKKIGYDTGDILKFLNDHGYEVIISEWYPIINYGGKHKWKRFVKHPVTFSLTNAWGNIIAYNYKKYSDFHEYLFDLEKE